MKRIHPRRILTILAATCFACSATTVPPSTLEPEVFQVWCGAFMEYQEARVSYHLSDSEVYRAEHGEEVGQLRLALLMLEYPPELEGRFPWPAPTTREEVESQPRRNAELLDWVDEHCGYRLPRLTGGSFDA